MNQRGTLFDIFVFLIVTFIIFIFFAAFIYGFNLLTTQVTTIANPSIPSGVINISGSAQETFGQINSALPALRWIALVIIISMIISIMVSNFLVKAHPVFFIVYILIVIVAVILSAYLSNAYESILTAENPLTSTLQSFTGMNFIMLHLPIWATIVGIAGAIFLFLGVIVDRDQGGSIPI